MRADEGWSNPLGCAPRRKFQRRELLIAVDQMCIKTREFEHRGQIGRNGAFTGATFFATYKDTSLYTHNLLSGEAPPEISYVARSRFVYTRIHKSIVVYTC